jgi:hypothetical protein
MARSLARRSRAVVLTLGGAGVWLGCNAIAGIQLGTLAETSDGGSGGDGSITGGDASSSGGDGGGVKTDGGAPTDAGNNAADQSSGDGGGAKPVVCTPTSPFLVTSLQNATDGGRQLDYDVTIGLTQDRYPRIVVRNNNGSYGELFRAYDVHWAPTSLNGSTIVTGQQGTYMQRAVVTPSGITALISSQNWDPDAGATGTTILAQPIPASAQLSSLPSPYPLTQAMSSFNGTAMILELSPEDDFVYLQNGDPVGGGSVLSAERSSRVTGPGPVGTFGSSTQQHFDPPAMVHGGNSVFVMTGTDPGSDAGTYIYKLPDRATISSPVTPTPLSTPLLVAGVYPSTSDSSKIATFVATLVTTPTPTFTLYAGLLQATSFDSLQLGTLAQGPSLSVHEVPAGKSGSTYINDTLAVAGTSPIASDQGINFLWVDVQGNVLATAVGDNRLYHDRTGIQASALIASDSIPGALTSFYVAWIEEHTDDAGLYDSVYVDQVQCAPP